MMVSETGRLKLMDFGLASGDHTRLTATGMVMGTPSFTAPELMMGKSPSAATDRYAFAVTAFELLSGSLPFAGESLGSTLYRIVHDPPNIPEGMDPQLTSIFLKALAKDPEDRYSDLKNFMIELIRACPLSTQVQNKLLNYVEAESSGQDMLAREPVTGGAAPAEDPASKVETPIVKPSEASSGGVSPTSAVPADPKAAAKGKAPDSKPIPAKPRPSGPPLNLNWSNLLGKPPAPTLPKPPPSKAPVLRIPAPSAKTVTPKSGMPNPAPGPFPFKLRVDAPLLSVPEVRDKHQHADLNLPEPIFDLEAGPIDDPFKDLDWDSALSAPEPSAEVLLGDDLGSPLDEPNGVEVPDHNKANGKDVEVQEQVKAMESLLDGLSRADVLEAENRAESEEALHDLEHTLGKVDL